MIIMEQLTGYYLTALTIVALGWGAAALIALTLHATERARTAQRNRAIEEIATLVAADAPPRYEEIDALRQRHPLSIIAEAAAYVADNIGGPRLYRVAMMAERCCVYDYFRYAAASSSGLRRARHLAMLAKFPLTQRYYDYVAGYLDSPTPQVRFYALGVQLIARADTAMHHLAEFGRPLTTLELSELISMLRHSTCPVAYMPLLCSECHNLRMLGITLATRFGLSDCEALLCDIIRSDDDCAISALHALVSLGATLSRDEVRHLIAHMAPERRNSLYRRLARAGYSARAIRHLLTASERQYFESLSNTYKRQIACS